MNPVALPELLQGLAESVPAVNVTGIALDSRRVMPGNLFLAAQGVTGRHGLAFVDDALQRGAAAVAWEPAPGVDVPSLPVPTVVIPELALRSGEIASRFFARPADQLFTVGITGTDGKTSTAWLTAQALERLGRPCAYFGTLGTGRLPTLAVTTHTTLDPVTLQSELARHAAAGIRAVAMEVSSHALDQRRVAGMRFDVAVLTNITRDHLDYHGTEAAYVDSKRALFARYCRGVAVINRDDTWGRRWLDAFPDVLTYGLEGDIPAEGDYLIGRDLALRPDGLTLRLQGPEGSATVASRLLGRFNAYNLLAAAAALRVGGLRLDDIADALAEADTVPGRIEGFRAAGQPLVVVDYAHTPAALTQVLRALREHCSGRITVVFGCGGDRDRGKRPLMGAAAAGGADRLFITDDNPRSESPAAIVDEILSGVAQGPGAPGLTVEHDRGAAIRAAVAAAGPDDVVLVAGKGHETQQIIGTTKVPFSDRAFVAELLGLEARA